MVLKKSSCRPVALVTGASAGIGAALAQCFAAHGHDLILVARSLDKLQVLAAQFAAAHGITVVVEAVDLAVPGAAARLARQLARKGHAVDVLVNCAGVMTQSAFGRMQPVQHQQIIDLNISALTAMLAHFVAPMAERGHGRVLNVASVAAFQPIPMLATYAASKAYVLSLSESLAEELKGKGVTVTALCPGITATQMLASAREANPLLARIPGFLIADVDEVARLGFAACMRGDVICVPGTVNRTAMVASRAAPKWLVRRLGGLIGRRVG